MLYVLDVLNEFRRIADNDGVGRYVLCHYGSDSLNFSVQRYDENGNM